MSSYLTFYLVPKKTRKKYGYDENEGNTETEEEISTGKPLVLFSFSRNNDVYQAYNNSLNPAYAGMEEKYTEVTYEDSQKVVNDFEEPAQALVEAVIEVDAKDVPVAPV